MILGRIAGLAFIVALKQQGKIQIPTCLQQSQSDLSELVYVGTFMCE